MLRHAVGVCLGIGLFLSVATAVAGEDTRGDDGKTGNDKKVRQDAVMRGDAECTFCHDEEDSTSLLAIGKTKHGTLADSRTPTCTSCHGASREHLKKESGQDKRPKPDITYGRRSPKIRPDARIDENFGNFKTTDTPAATINKTCMTCHQGDKLLFWSSSAHVKQEVACTNCHDIHTDHDRVLDKRSQPSVCFGCHKTQRAMFNRPSHHPVPEGKMSCSNCHNPHGSTGHKSLRWDSINETCYQCHMEKRGPFLHMHPPVAENCLICHNPHGTVVADLLNYRPPYLCQNCHSSTTHRGQVPGLPGVRTTNMSQLGTVARGCVKCHVNIHGSNSTENATRTGRFQR
ncbi:MAG: DmsE family decaheme c-type cytochrome [Magnetococcales bacterium]|nr:DmsE family decaheme c-type cytochrome [Magnetococcales bacterium]